MKKLNGYKTLKLFPFKIKVTVDFTICTIEIWKKCTQIYNNCTNL